MTWVRQLNDHHVEKEQAYSKYYEIVFLLELQTFKILAAERLRLIKLGTRLIADYFQHTVNILKW